MRTTLYYIGATWLILLGSLIVACSLSIILSQGIWKFLEIMSPFNFVNWIVVAVMAAPGVALVHFCERPRKEKVQLPPPLPPPPLPPLE
jgi:hypothetical protein